MRDALLILAIFCLFAVRCTPVVADDFQVGGSVASNRSGDKYEYNEDSELLYLGYEFNKADSIDVVTYKTAFGDRVAGVRYGVTLPVFDTGLFVGGRIGIVHGYNDSYVVCKEGATTKRQSGRPRQTPTGCYEVEPKLTYKGYALTGTPAVGYQFTKFFNIQVGYDRGTWQFLTEFKI